MTDGLPSTLIVLITCTNVKKRKILTNVYLGGSSNLRNLTSLLKFTFDIMFLGYLLNNSYLFPGRCVRG